jgi:hypothetical protein
MHTRNPSFFSPSFFISGVGIRVGVGAAVRVEMRVGVAARVEGVMAPTLRVPDEGTLGAELIALRRALDKLPEGRWCKGYTFGGFQAA